MNDDDTHRAMRAKPARRIDLPVRTGVRRRQRLSARQIIVDHHAAPRAPDEAGATAPDGRVSYTARGISPFHQFTLKRPGRARMLA